MRLLALITAIFGCLCGFHALAEDIRQANPIAEKANVDSVIQRAQGGDKQAQFDLATYYGRGIGVQVNHNLAWEWVSKAAENGQAEAQYWRGYDYYYGHRENTDKVKALEWFKKSAEQGFLNAQFMVASILDANENPQIPRQPKEALQWYSKAGNKGHAESAFRLGCKSYFGEDVGKDEKIAMSWFEIAGKNGDPVAADFLTNKDEAVLRRICRQ